MTNDFWEYLNWLDSIDEDGPRFSFPSEYYLEFAEFALLRERGSYGDFTDITHLANQVSFTFKGKRYTVSKGTSSWDDYRTTICWETLVCEE